MRRRAKVDSNQRAVKQALELMGCTVVSLAAVGDGCPDLLVGYRGANLLIEVKNREGRAARKEHLTEEQGRFRLAWRGQFDVAYSPEDACRLVKGWEHFECQQTDGK